MASMSAHPEIAQRAAHAFSALALAATGCGAALVGDEAAVASRSRESWTRTVEVVAEVLDFKRDAMWEHYVGGGFACFAGTRVRILSPDDVGEKDMTLLHGTEPPADSPWRSEGARLRFRLPWDSLHPKPGTSHTPFADALEVEYLTDRR